MWLRSGEGFTPAGRPLLRRAREQILEALQAKLSQSQRLSLVTAARRQAWAQQRDESSLFTESCREPKSWRPLGLWLGVESGSWLPTKQDEAAERTQWVCCMASWAGVTCLHRRISSVLLQGLSPVASGRLDSGKKPRRKLPGARKGPRLCQRSDASPGPGPWVLWPVDSDTASLRIEKCQYLPLRGGAARQGPAALGLVHSESSRSPFLGVPAPPACSRSSSRGRHLLVTLSPAETWAMMASKHTSKYELLG